MNFMKYLDRLIKPSTRAFLREARNIRGYSLFDLLHGYVYLRWPYFYIAMGKGDHPLARRMTPVLNWIGKMIAAGAGKREEQENSGFEDTYHGKVVPLNAARELISIREEVRIQNLEQVIPFKRAKDIVLKNPEAIVVLDCPCRVAKPDPCLPLDVCLIVGEPFASFVMEHHGKRARRITSQEAERILREEDERGHVHHAFFKDAVLERFYAICNCCACCCGAMKAQKQGTPMLISSGFICRVRADLCQACGLCESRCQFHAISVEEVARVDESACMGCGVCVNHCPNGALSLERDRARPEPLEIVRLIHENREP